MHAIFRVLQNPKKIKMKGRLWRAFICLFDYCSLEKILKLIIMVGKIHFLWKTKCIRGLLLKLPFESCENHLQRSLKILGGPSSLLLAVLHGDLYNVLLSIQALVAVLAAPLSSHFNFWPQRAALIASYSSVIPELLIIMAWGNRQSHFKHNCSSYSHPDVALVI